MNVPDPLQYLFEQIRSRWFIHLPSLAHIRQKIASCTEFYYENMMFFCLKSLKKLNNGGMSHGLKDISLIIYLLYRMIIFQILFVNRFNCHQLSRQHMHRQINFAERTSA